MWLGPVFQAELLTVARRPSFFRGRTLYGILVLIIVVWTYYSMLRFYIYNGDEEIPINAMADFGQGIFFAFAWLQGLILTVLTPALVAGAIADEKQRKTLHYLMASQLSATEIVVGKVAARLLRVGVIGAIGLPILSLISLFGGVDFELVLMVYGATATTTFFLASLSILCSVFAPKPRDAIMRSYFYEILWLLVAPLALSTMSLWDPTWQSIGEFCSPAIEWVAISSPTDLFRGNLVFSMHFLFAKAWWMMGAQVAYGTIFITIAALRLRPHFRGLGAPGWMARVLKRKTAPTRWRIWARPRVGDDAMLWKEMYLHRVSDARRIVLVILGLVVVGSAIYGAWDIIVDAVNEVDHDGYWAYGRARRDIHAILQAVNAIAMVVALVGLGAVSASSITSEREADTWTNLTSSPIDGPEFIRGKILGTMWLFRPLGYFLAGCWVFGVALGAVHPIGMIISAVELILFSWFVASLGVFFSLRSKNTAAALVRTIGSLAFLTAGYLFIILVTMRSTSTLALFGCTPYIFTQGLLGMDQLTLRSSGYSRQVFTTCVAGVGLYTGGAVALTLSAMRSYDKIVDRPDRSRSELTPELLRKIQAAATKPTNLLSDLA